MNSKRDRREHMDRLLTKMGVQFERIEGFKHDNKLTSGSINHLRVCQNALSYNPFSPFVLLEDDCDLFSEEFDLLKEIDIPNSADAIYLGTSKCGSNSNDFFDSPILQFKSVDGHRDLLRDYNMLGAHAILFVTPRFASAYSNAMVSSIYSQQDCEVAWDALTCRLKQFFQTYVFKTPIFYQNSSVGGQEEPTKWVIPEEMWDTVNGAHEVHYHIHTLFTQFYALRHIVVRYEKMLLNKLCDVAWMNTNHSMKISSGDHIFDYSDIGFDGLYIHKPTGSIGASIEYLISLRGKSLDLSDLKIVYIK